MRLRAFFLALLSSALVGCVLPPSPSCDLAPASHPWFEASWQHGGNVSALQGALERIGWKRLPENSTYGFALTVNESSTLNAAVTERAGGSFHETVLFVEDRKA